MNRCCTPPNRMSGGSMLGLLVSMVIIAVLFAILMNGLSTFKGGGTNQSVLPNTLASARDRTTLYAIYQSMYVNADRRSGRFVVPSELAQHDDRSADTTASLFSTMVAQNYIDVNMLVSDNEHNPWVIEDDDYDYSAYQPQQNQWWDPGFQADLELESNVSYAHMPLHGQRLRDRWKTEGRSNFPLLGSRGPRDGQIDPNSFTCTDDGQWAGIMVFGDGHIDYVNGFTMGGLSVPGPDGQSVADNMYRVDEGLEGNDAIITFTKSMGPDGPVFQWD